MTETKKTAKSKQPEKEKDPAFKAMDERIPTLAKEVTESFSKFVAKLASDNKLTNARTVVQLENYGYRRLMNEIIFQMKLPIRFERRPQPSK